MRKRGQEGGQGGEVKRYPPTFANRLPPMFASHKKLVPTTED